MVKILSWNINGLRSQKNNINALFNDLKADIICIQETKVTRDLLEEPLAIIDGYHSFFSFSRKRTGYSGVATFCKKEVAPCFAQEGLGGTLGVGCLAEDSGSVVHLHGSWNTKDLKDLDAEGRCLITQHSFLDNSGCKQILSVINVYCPRADPDRPERALYKLSFYELLRQRSAALKASGSYVVILGDVNTSHRRIDHCDPDDDQEFEKREDRLFLDNFCFNFTSSKFCNELIPKEVEENMRKEGSGEPLNEEGIEEVNCQVIDTFRYFHPDRKEAFTCWNTKVNARATNYGTRIDYVLCDKDFLTYIQDSSIHPDIMGSDHCPVSIQTQKINLLPSDSLPTICTKYYPEFCGSQQKLSSYFKTNPDNKNGLLPGNTDLLINNKNISHNYGLGNSKRKLNTIDKISSNSKRKNCRAEPKQTTLNSFFNMRKSNENNSSPEVGSQSETQLLECQLHSSDVRELDDFCSSQKSESSIDSSLSSNSNLGDFVNSESRNLDISSKNNLNLSKVEPHLDHSTKGSNWGFLMKGPAPAPLCPGHKEPSVLRTVKKKGPNLNRQFYSCSKGVGKEGDPNSRCNFFKWVKK